MYMRVEYTTDNIHCYEIEETVLYTHTRRKFISYYYSGYMLR